MNNSKEDSNSNSKDVILHKFVIMLNHIKLDVTWPIQLKIKWDNGMLSQKTYYTCKPIMINPKDDKDHEIVDGYKEYEVMMDQTEMKIALTSNPLKIQICNKSVPFAKATADLGKLLTPDAENLRYGQRYRQDIPIFGMNNGYEMMGTINGTFILEREKGILCKYYDVHFKPSNILKHAKGNKICKPKYEEEDLETLQTQSEERKREKRNIRNWMNYDPAKRAKLHSKYYNPTSRAEKHRKNVSAEMGKEREKNGNEEETHPE